MEKRVKKNCPHCEKENKPKKHNSTKTLLTRNGLVTILYDIYKCSCRETYYSDNHKYRGITINEKEVKVSPQIAGIITRMGASARSFQDAEIMLKELNFASISAPQIREITEYIGTSVFEDLEKEATETYDNMVELSNNDYQIKKGLTMVIEFDGSMLRKIIEKGTEWNELKLGCIMIKNSIGKVIQKEYISYFGAAENFKKFLFHLAVEMNYMEMEKIEVVSDGAHWIWNIVSELFPNAIEVLDYYHCKENVYEYYKFVYQEDENKAKKEAEKIMKKIDGGVKIKTIVSQIPTVDSLPVGVVNLPNYLTYHQQRIKYKEFLNQGIDIGSGVIEGGNKNVIQHRMKQTGMKWLESSIKAVSSLRCKSFSNRWNDVLNKIQGLFPAFV